MLITKKGKIKWNGGSKKLYEEKGYIYTKQGDIFEVNIEDLPDYSKCLVDVQCDGCGEILKDIIWNNYKRSVKEDGKYYCHKCSTRLYGGEKGRKTRLIKGKSFYDWCYENLSKEEADEIMARWDYEKNVDKNGNVLSPKDVGHGSRSINGQGCWFKCLDNPEHGSELKNISSFTNDSSGVNLQCIQCNSIAMTHPHLIKYLVNKEDAYKYSMGSSKIRILMKCPDCGYEKKRSINQLRKQGFSCPKCSDGVPYPEKFMFNVLEQLLDKDFKNQLSKTTFQWCGKYRYDFYLNKIKGIIETMGLQHYEEVGNNWGTLKETQDNDFDKEWLAKENKVKNYIILDCRKSEMECIKNSIMSSRLPKLLNFKEEDIDWLKAHEYGCSNIIKLTCKMWDNEINNALKISQELKLHKSTIIKYLKQGAMLGWCDYDSKKEFEKNRNKLCAKFSIKVICLTTGEIFNSQKEAKIKYNIKDSGISRCCHNRQKTCGKHPITKEPLRWMLYSEYIKSQIFIMRRSEVLKEEVITSG